jgi:hypothetical protein
VYRSHRYIDQVEVLHQPVRPTGHFYRQNRSVVGRVS